MYVGMYLQKPKVYNEKPDRPTNANVGLDRAQSLLLCSSASASHSHSISSSYLSTTRDDEDRGFSSSIIIGAILLTKLFTLISKTDQKVLRLRVLHPWCS